MLNKPNENNEDLGGYVKRIPSYLLKFKFDPKALRERQTTVGGSDINIICSGNTEHITKLYNQKIGAIELDDLSTVWAVVMGHVTEDLNLTWVEWVHQVDVMNKQKVLQSSKYPFMRCTLDGSINNWKDSVAVIDAKFSLGRPLKDELYSEVDARLIKKYTPQIHWNAYLLEEQLGKKVKYGLISLLKAGNEPKVHEIEIDTEYQEYLIEIAEKFIHCVNEKIPPFIPEQIDPPTPIEDRVEYDMTSHEKRFNWLMQEQVIMQTRGASESYNKAVKTIKALVPKDASIALGEAIKVKVSKNNRKTMEIISE